MQLPHPKTVILSTILLVGVLPIFTVTLLFTYGISTFPRENAPTRHPSQQAAKALWLDVGGISVMPLQPRGTLETLEALALYFDTALRPDPVQRLAGQVAKAQMTKHFSKARALEWNLAGVAGTLYIMRTWTPLEMAAYLEPAQYFGRDLVGFNAASQFYFGKSTTDLTDPQTVALAVVMRSPSRFDPLCRFSSLREFALHHYETNITSPSSVGLVTPHVSCDDKMAN